MTYLIIDQILMVPEVERPATYTDVIGGPPVPGPGEALRLWNFTASESEV
jgi:hypothetical protein